MKARKTRLALAVGAALAGLASGAHAETITGVTTPLYDVKFGDWYTNAGGYAGAQYHYAVGVDLNVSGTPNGSGNYDVTYSAVDGFGDAGDVWTVRGDEHVFNDPMINGHTFIGTGQLSWCQGGTCAGASGTSAGWNHTSQHVLFAVTTEADIKITLSNAPGVEGHDGPNETLTNAIAGDLKPGFTLFSGVSTSGWNDLTHTFTNAENFTLQPKTVTNAKTGITTTQVPSNTDLIYYDLNANTANASSIDETYHLTPGLYSLWIGGNNSNIAANDSTLPCLTHTGPGGTCTGYGSHGKNFQLTIETAAVPLPAAVWLFGSALAGMGVIGKRRERTLA